MAGNYSSKWLKVSEPFPHVLHIEVARPPVNAFSIELSTEYGKLFDSLTQDGYDVRAAVVSSVLPKLFTAGIDLDDFVNFADGALENAEDSGRASFQIRKSIVRFQSSVSAPRRTPFPVIVALHGHVLGLGVDIIGPCDIRYAASNTSFSIKEVDIGLAPDIGTLTFIPKITGNDSLVRELVYTCRPFSAFEAEKLGLVSKVVQGGRDEVVMEALELAKIIANKSPVAVASAKHLISHALDHSVSESLSYTSVWNSSALMTKDIQEAMARNDPPDFAPLKAKL